RRSGRARRTAPFTAGAVPFLLRWTRAGGRSVRTPFQGWVYLLLTDQGLPPLAIDERPSRANQEARGPRGLFQQLALEDFGEGGDDGGFDFGHGGGAGEEAGEG